MALAAKDGAPVILEQLVHASAFANEQRNRTTPSYVAFTDIGCLIGDAAKNQGTVNPTNYVFVPGVGDKLMIVIDYKNEKKQFLVEEISSMILSKMREIVETYLGTTWTTHPRKAKPRHRLAMVAGAKAITEVKRGSGSALRMVLRKGGRGCIGRWFWVLKCVVIYWGSSDVATA
ncbi:hypothetical protein ACLB2K_021010 [Fragaria x ananassa]